MTRREPEIHSITTASTSRSDDVFGREKRYLMSMGLRVVCFVAGVIVLVGHGPVPRFVGWILIVVATVIPYIAVVAANAVRGARPGEGPGPVTPQDAPRLQAGERWHPPTP